MEQGGMRLEANISLSPDENLPNYKVELKNINSFRFMEKAVEFEMRRQEKILRDGKVPPQETRGWNEAKGETFIQRTKEDAEDYRYFPDPDIPPLQFTKEQIETWRSELPELPVTVLKRWEKEFGVSPKNGELLFESQLEREWAEALFVHLKQNAVDANAVANAIVNKKIAVDHSHSAAQILTAFQALTKTDDVPESEIRETATKVIAANADAVASYKAGKTQVIGFFIGQTTKQVGKKLDPKRVAQIVQEMLSSS
jgi:aspartyl-tRNA(Asn)/glutamyl-tRNA(Gln) amidotransferase subunit B